MKVPLVWNYVGPARPPRHPLWDFVLTVVVNLTLAVAVPDAYFSALTSGVKVKVQI